MKKVLVIDDDVDLAETIKSILKYAGYGVLVSHDGQEGINTAKEQKPDLILMDVVMPGMDGAEAVAVLKEEPGLRDIPVIFLTGLVEASGDSSSAGLNVGGAFYKTLAKPFENEKLKELVQETLGQDG